MLVLVRAGWERRIATACMVRFTWSAAAFILLMPSACPASFCSMEPDWSMRNRKDAGLARLISGALLMVSPTLAFWIVRSVGTVVYCARGAVFFMATLCSVTVGEQVQMPLIAVGILHTVATKKGRNNPALLASGAVFVAGL